MVTVQQHILRTDDATAQYSSIDEHDAQKLLSDIEYALQCWAAERGYDVTVEQDTDGSYRIDTMRAGTDPGKDATGRLVYGPGHGEHWDRKQIRLSVGELPEDDAKELTGWIGAAVETEDGTFAVLDAD